MCPIPKDNHHKAHREALKVLSGCAVWTEAFPTAEWSNSQHRKQREGVASTVSFAVCPKLCFSEDFVLIQSKSLGTYV